MNLETLKTDIVAQMGKQRGEILTQPDTIDNRIFIAQYNMTINDISKARTIKEVKIRLDEFGFIVYLITGKKISA